MRRLLPLVLLAAACGEVPDAPIDAPDVTEIDAAASGPVDVTFYYYMPVPDAPIFLFDADGNLILETTTGADGKKHLDDVPRGASLTVGKVLGGAPRVRSVYGLEPGDNLVLGEGSLDTTTTNLALTSQLAGITRYDLGAGCGQISTTLATVPALNRCKTGGAWTVAALAWTSATTVSQFTVITGVTGNTALTAWQPATQLGDFLLGYSNPFAGTTNVDASFDYGYPVVGANPQTFTAASGTASWRYPGGANPMLTYRVTARNATSGSTFVRTIAPIRMENVNIAGLMLPYLTGLTGDFTDKLRPTLSWEVDTTTATASDLIDIRANWDGPGFYDWDVILPASAAHSFRYPAIPTSHVDLLPPSGAQWFYSATVSYIDATGKDYRMIRQFPDQPYDGRTTYRTFNVSSL